MQLKVLMFGWEFPPHISGGLGTACQGLTKGLSVFNDIEVTFVVPKAHGDENSDLVKLIGAADIPLSNKKMKFKNSQNEIKYFKIKSHIVPYTNPDEFWKLTSLKHSGKTQFLQTDEYGRVPFTGKYGMNLIDEVFSYAMVAGKIAGEKQFDLIHAHDWMTFQAGIEAKRISGKPLIVHIHSTDFDRSGGNVNPQIYAIEREGMEYADKIVAVSEYTKLILVEKYGISAKKIQTIYNGVEPFDLRTGNEIKKGFKEKLVTFLGRVTSQKGPGYFVEAASEVLRRNNNVRFVMAGSGDMLNEMVRRAAQLKIADRFHFTGFLENHEVQSLYQMSDVYVLPSVSEPFGISVLEAAQGNVPVVVSKQSGVSEVLNNVLKVDYWDVHALADAIHALIEYPALGICMKKRAHAEVLNMNWDVPAGQLRQLYIQTCKTKHSRNK